MNRQDKRTHVNPSFNIKAGLLPLESALIAAEKMTPSRVPHRVVDPDEALAAKLIENIKHPRSPSISNMQIESPQPFHHAALHELAGRDV